MTDRVNAGQASHLRAEDRGKAKWAGRQVGRGGALGAGAIGGKHVNAQICI
jgi:hypothetical protein